MPETVAAYTAEFVGTFLLVFTVGFNVIAGDATWAVTSIAAVLMVSIYALGEVSGAHFNPAVSVAIGAVGAAGWKEVRTYCAVQLAAGISAGLCAVLLLGQSHNVAPAGGFGWWEAGLAEMLYTFVLCFVVLNCAISKRNGCGTGNEFYGLAIGFVIVAGGYSAGAISGGCFNPAVALGLDVSSAGLGFGWGVLYTVYELVGAAAAAVLYMVVRPDDFGGRRSEDSWKARTTWALHGGTAPYELWVKCVSECTGTFVLVLTVLLNILQATPAAGAWSIAASLMCMIYALGNCSGAHFNPAVTLAILLSGRDKTNPEEAAKYVGSQLIGAILAAYTAVGMYHGQTKPLEPVAPYKWAHALIGEVVFTFVLCFVVLCVATTATAKPMKHLFGLAIGSCVTAGGLALGNISGGSLNPAVSVGISSSRLLGGGLFYNCLLLVMPWRLSQAIATPAFIHCLLYSAAECLGAVAAAGIFRVTHPAEYDKGLLPLTGADKK